jgi:hypothetical protein
MISGFASLGLAFGDEVHDINRSSIINAPVGIFSHCSRGITGDAKLVVFRGLFRPLPMRTKTSKVLKNSNEKPSRKMR